MRRMCRRYMHCDRCPADHLEALFSDAEWQTSHRQERKCLAYGGRVVLCNHFVVRLTDIEDLIKLRRGQGCTAIDRLFYHTFPKSDYRRHKVYYYQTRKKATVYIYTNDV